jgi:phosphoribosyl-AMP cyclohydrolase
MTTLVTNTAAALAQQSDSADGTDARPLTNAPGWLDAVKWDAKGLCTAIAQDASSKRILMVAWMNREALQLTAMTGKAVYWSRSRERLWHKGEESGHIQLVNELRLDCDGDVILLLVDQVGGLACHTGREACFFHKLANNQWVITDPVVKDPELIYK